MRLSWVIFCALALAAGGLSGFATTASAQTEGGTVTLYNVACPPGYDGDDLYGDCYDNPIPGRTFQVGSLDLENQTAVSTGTTDDSGSVTLSLEGMAPGTVRLGEIVNGEYQEYFAVCTKNGGETLPFEYRPVQIDPGGDFWAIDFQVEPGDQVVCDWFSVPVAGDDEPAPMPGSLSIYRVSCPAGYQGDDYYDDCYDNPQAGVEFVLSEQGQGSGVSFTTGANGLAATGLPLSEPSTLVVTEVPGDSVSYLDYVVICSKNGGQPVEVDYGQANVLDAVFDAEPGDEIVCDWFFVPPADGGEDPIEGDLTIYVTACPDGYTGDDYFNDCYDNPQAGVGLVASARIGVLAETSTDDSGFAQYTFEELGVFEPPAAGEHEAGISIGIDTTANDFAVYCSKNGGDPVEVFSLNGGPAGLAGVGIPGEDVEPGDEIRCDWYLLTATDDDDDGVGPVTRLPNTGAGTLAERETSLIGVALPVALALVATAAAAAAYRGRWALGWRAVRSDD